MRIDCQHGYFRFTESEAEEISRFMSLFEVEIELNEDHFTFSDLVGAPDYSLPGGTFLGSPTSVAFQGSPAEVMRANGLVYNFNTGLVVPILSIIKSVQLIESDNSFLSSGMILPGSLTDDGIRVTDYSAFYIPSRQSFKYTEVDGE